MELGTEDYYYQEHQYEDAHHEAVLAGDYGDLEGGVGGRQAAAAAARAKRKAQRAAAQEAQTQNIRMGTISLGGPAVTAAALRRQRIAKIQDFTHKYIVRCRLPPLEEMEEQEKSGKELTDDGEESKTRPRSDKGKEVTESGKKEETPMEEIITVEHLQELMLHFYESTVDIQAVLQKEMRSMKIKSQGTRLMDTVKTKAGTEWQINSAAFNVITSAHRPSLALPSNSPSQSAAFLAPQISGSLEPIVGVDFDGNKNPALTSVGAQHSPRGHSPNNSSALNTRVSMTSALLNEFTLSRNKKRLSEDEFIVAMQSVLGHLTVSEAECRAWFRQIDGDNSGTVGWEEFSAYLLSLSEHRTHVDNRPFALGINLYPPSCHPWNRHTGPISCAFVHPVTGTIYTGGEDGLIMSWNATSLRNQTLIHRGVSWVVGLKLMKDGRLAAATVERELLIFDLKANELVRSYKGKCSLKGEMGMSYAYSTTDVVSVNEKLVGHLTPKNAKVTSNRADNREKYRRLKSGTASHLVMAKDEVAMITKGAKEERANETKQLEQATLLGLVDAPTCIDYHYSAVDQDLIFFGTRAGSVLIYEITNSHERVVRLFYKMQVHQKRINHMEVIPLLEAILTCSDDCSLRLTSLETGGLIREFSKDVGHKMGVTTFVFSQACKLFISISGERKALVWDYLQEAPVYTLEEHNAPLLSACINEKDKQIITLSADNTVRISDLVTHKTLQTVSHRHTVRSSAIAEAKESDNVPNFCTMLFDQHRCRHFVFSSFPQMYKLRQSEHSFPSHYSGHVEPVMHLIYSSMHKQLVSFDAESCIVWDQGTGATRFSFAYTTNFSPAIEEFKLTCTGWDLTQRRLLCGYHQGTVVVWNYSNGQALNVIQDSGIQQATRYGSEVAAVCSTMLGDTAMYVYGVGRRLLYCPESQVFTIQRASAFELPEAHGALTALDKVNNHLIAIGTSTGALLVYNLTLEEQDGKAMVAADYTDGILPSQSNPLHRPSEGSTHSLSTTNPHLTNTVSPRGNSPPHHIAGRPSLANTSSTLAGRSASTPTSRSNAFQSELKRQAAITSSRIEKIFVINKKEFSAPLIMVVHNDGRVVLWHATKRTFICSLMMTGAGGSSPSCFDLDSLTHQTLAYCDTLGNITVWDIHYEEVSLLDTLRKHTRNPMVAADVGQFTSGVHETIPSIERSTIRSSFHAHQKQITSVVVIPSAHETSIANKKLAAMKAHHSPGNLPSAQPTVNPLSTFEYRTPESRGDDLKRMNSKLSQTAKMPSSFRLYPDEGLNEFDHVDRSMLSNIEGSFNPPPTIAVTSQLEGSSLNAGTGSPMQSAHLLSGTTPGSGVLNAGRPTTEGSFTNSSFRGSHSGVYYEPTIATCSVDCMVKLWTIEGHLIGEYGMKKWSLEQELSWKRRVPESPYGGVIDGAEGNRSVASLLLQPQRTDSLALLTEEIEGHLPSLSASKVPPLKVERITNVDVTLPPISCTTSPRSPVAAPESARKSTTRKVLEDAPAFHVPLQSPSGNKILQTVSYLVPNHGAVDDLMSIKAPSASTQRPNQQLLAMSSPRPALELHQKTSTMIGSPHHGNGGSHPHPPTFGGILKAKQGPASHNDYLLESSAMGMADFSFMRSNAKAHPAPTITIVPTAIGGGRGRMPPKQQYSRQPTDDVSHSYLIPISPQVGHLDTNVQNSRHYTGFLGSAVDERPSSFLSVGEASQRDDVLAAVPSSDDVSLMLTPTPPHRTVSEIEGPLASPTTKTPGAPSGRKLLYSSQHSARKTDRTHKAGSQKYGNESLPEGERLSPDETVRIGAASSELVILSAPTPKESPPAIAISGPSETLTSMYKTQANKVPLLLQPPPPLAPAGLLTASTSLLASASAAHTPLMTPLQASYAGVHTGINPPLSPPSAVTDFMLTTPPPSDLAPGADILSPHVPTGSARSQTLALNAVRERHGRLQQYGLGEEVKLIEQRLLASNNSKAIQGRLRTEKPSAAEQLRARKAARDGTDRLEALGLGNAPTDASATDGGGEHSVDGQGSSRPSDGIETILRLSSQMMVVALDDIRPPARSVEAQEEARRGGRKIYGVRAAGQSSAPTFTAPGVGGKSSPRR